MSNNTRNQKSLSPSSEKELLESRNLVKRKACSCLSLLSLGLMFSACAGQKIREDIGRDISRVRNVQAEHTASIDALRAELRNLSGQVEELQFRSLGKTRELERTINDLGSRVPPASGVPAELLAKDEQLISRQTGQAADDYKTALRKIRTGDYQTALSALQSFLKQNPNTTFSDNAYFWSGVCLDNLGDVGGAIASYSEVYSRFPAEDFVPAALFHMGKSFQKLSSNQEARDTFSKLVDDFPRSEYAQKAKRELRQSRRR